MFFLENLSPEQQEQARSNLENAGLPSSRYYILTTLGIIIATFGLILNSPAIVIGAMLVAPLMLPILLLSLSIVTGRTRLLFKTLESLVKGIVLSVIISTFITLLVPIYEIPSEVLARAQPAILDMFIALAAGAAAMYAMIKKDSATLPGVAVSVSLMPPLSALGIGLAMRNISIAAGAGLLFLTNLVAIVFSGAIILLLFKFKPYAKTREGVLKQGAIINVVLIAILSIILTSSFVKVSATEKQKHAVKDELSRQLQALEKGELESFTIENRHGQLQISARILSSTNLTAEDMEILTNALAFRLEKSVNLQATVIPILLGGKILPPSEVEKIRQEKLLNPSLENKAPLASLSAQLYMAPMEPITTDEKEATNAAESIDEKGLFIATPSSQKATSSSADTFSDTIKVYEEKD